MNVSFLCSFTVPLFLDQELILYRYSSCSSCCWGDLFKSDRDEIRQECSSGEFPSIDEVGFSILRHTFKMVAADVISVISRRKVLPPGE